MEGRLIPCFTHIQLVSKLNQQEHQLGEILFLMLGPVLLAFLLLHLEHVQHLSFELLE